MPFANGLKERGQTLRQREAYPPDDPKKIAANVQAMTDTALTIYRLGHLPVMGEWFALPLIEAAGSKHIGDAAFNEIFHPVAVQLIGHCDAVLRTGGPSSGADEMVASTGCYNKQNVLFISGNKWKKRVL